MRSNDLLKLFDEHKTAVADVLARMVIVVPALPGTGAETAIGDYAKALLKVARAYASTRPFKRGLSAVLHEALTLKEEEHTSGVLELARFALYDGRHRLCLMFMRPDDLDDGVHRGSRVAFSRDEPLTEHNSVPIRHVTVPRFLDSGVGSRTLIEVGMNERDLKMWNEFQLKTGDVDADARVYHQVCARMFEIPTRLHVRQPRGGTRHVLVDNRVPIPLEVARYGSIRIERTTRIESARFPTSTIVLAALGVDIRLRPGWEGRMDLGTTFKVGDRTHIVLTEPTRDNWRRLMRDVIDCDSRFTMDSLEEALQHPLEELLRVSNDDIENANVAEVVYLLARVVRYAERSGQSDLTLDALIKHVTGST